MPDTEPHFLQIALAGSEKEKADLADTLPIIELLHNGEQREWIKLRDSQLIEGTKIALTTDTMAIILEKKNGQWIYQGRYVILKDRHGAKIKADHEGSGMTMNQIGCDIVKIGGRSDYRVALTDSALVVSGKEVLAQGQNNGIVHMDHDYRGERIADQPGFLFSRLRIDDRDVPVGLTDFQTQNIYHTVVQIPKTSLPSSAGVQLHR